MRLSAMFVFGALFVAAPPTAGAEDDAPADVSTGISPTERLYPHPVITEVLFNVPRSDKADPNADGRRQANADEFVELFNPHPKPITLRGYTITNHITTFDDDTKRGVRFTFPAFTLEPGAVVVVFNGYEANIPGPVGDERHAPPKPNENFGGAYVFVINPSSRTCAFANSGDFVLLSDPHGKPIDGVVWGEQDDEPPAGTLRTSVVDKDPKGSVQRVNADAPMLAHRRIDGQMFSPGRLPSSDESGEDEEAR